MKNAIKYIIIILFWFSGSTPIFSQQNQVNKNKFLLVLDVQEYYTHNKLSESDANNFVNAVNKVIAKYNKEKVIYIKSTHKVLNLSLSKPFIYVDYDTSAMQFDKNLLLVNNNVFTKDEGNAFSVEDLNAFLEKNNAKEIVIVGLLAEECVYRTAIGGLKKGFDIYIIPQAIIGKSEKRTEKTYNKLISKNVKVLNLL